MARKIEYGRMLHGGDYNPEQWLDRPDILKKDIEYFKKAHINTVSVGIFSWAVLEPEEGKYNLGWLEEIIDNLYKEGISTILATPSGARPKWMADKYPEVLRMDPDRTRRFFGGRHNHCYTSPVYRQKVHDLDKLLSQRLGSHPGVILWHISNEFGGECYCPLCQQKFREWLKEKYGTIEKLNSSWCTTFWSHTYNSFDQIEAPSPKGEDALHALNLDWKRFVTDRTLDFIKEEISALREGGSELPVTANLMYDYNGLDYKKFRDVLDVVSWDNYPGWHKKEEYLTAIDAGMQHDLMRVGQMEAFIVKGQYNCVSDTRSYKKPFIPVVTEYLLLFHKQDALFFPFAVRRETTVDLRKEGDSLRLSIEDNGIGMPEDIREQIFSAFFTTKPVGEGTGLGLSITRSIIEEKHDGKIEVESKEGEFTRFIFLIPLTK